MTAAAGVEHGRASADWLALREPADAVARSAQLVEELIPLLRSELLGFVGSARSADRAKPTNPSNSGRQAGADREDWDHRAALTVHDLGSGTGSVRRWLAPRLPCPQRWVEHDRDAALLPTSLVPSSRAPSELLGFVGPARSIDRAGPTNPSESQGFGPEGVQDGGRIEEVTRCTCDLAELTAEHLEQADLITASALLDVLTGSTLDRLISAGAGLRVPMLLTLSVVGRIRLTPVDPFDPEVLAAFNDHQRRDTATGRLLGPDAVAYATRRCRDLGATVRSAPSPWLLGSTGSDDGRKRALTATWFTGWLDAAVEQRPELAARSGDYRRRRMTEVATGRLEVVVEHTDLLVWWP